MHKNHGRNLVIGLLLLLGASVAVGIRPANATHFRGGTTSWEKDLTFASPTQHRVIITMDSYWRWTFPYPSGATPGLGTLVQLGAPLTATNQFGTSLGSNDGNGVVTYIDSAADMFVARSVWTLTVAITDFPLTVVQTGGNRPSNLAEANHDTSWKLQMVVNTSQATRSPEYFGEPFLNIAVNQPAVFNLQTRAFDNFVNSVSIAPITSSLLRQARPVGNAACATTGTTPLCESCYASNAGSCADGLSVSPAGVVSWTPQTQGVYAVQFTVTSVDFNNVPKAAIPVEIQLAVVPSIPTRTPTPSSTITPTVTQTLTSSPVDTATPSPTATLPAEPTATPTDVPVATATATDVPSSTPTEPATPTETPVPSATETAIASVTETATPTVTATATSAPPPTLGPLAQACQIALGNAAQKYFNVRTAALQSCRMALNKSLPRYLDQAKSMALTDPAQCAGEYGAAKKINSAAVAVRKMIAKKCTNTEIAQLTACAASLDGIVDPTAMMGCLLENGTTAIDTLIDAEYGRLLNSSEKLENTCQNTIAGAARSYAKKRLAALRVCRNALIKGKPRFADKAKTVPVTDPNLCVTEYATAGKLAKAGLALRNGIAKPTKCTDVLVLNLASTCANTVDGLVNTAGTGGCLVSAGSVATDALIDSAY